MSIILYGVIIVSLMLIFYKHNRVNYKLYNINIDIIEVVVRGDN